MSYSAKHWSNVATVLPFMEKLTQSMGLGHIRAPIHTSVEFRSAEKVRYPNIHTFYIPGGSTDQLQPLDLTANKAFKSRWRTSVDVVGWGPEG